MSPVADRLFETIRSTSRWPRRLRVPLDEVRVAWQSVAGLAVTSAGSRRQLHDALQELADAERVTLPAGRHLWDDASPPLPVWVQLPAPSRPQRAEPRSYPWRPELSWVGRDRVALTDGQFELLKALQRWLAATHGARPDRVPFRERSFEVFGDEKALEGLLAVPALSGEGKVTLELLVAEAPALPAGAARVGGGPADVVLMVENAHPFWTLTRHLRGRDSRPVGWVVYGGGNQATATVGSLPELLEVPAGRLRVRYVGDVDAAGFDIARRVSDAAEVAGMGPVEPAVWLYELMLKVGTPQPTALPAGADPDELASWLPERVREPTQELLAAGRRISQEQITATSLDCHGADHP